MPFPRREITEASRRLRVLSMERSRSYHGHLQGPSGCTLAHKKRLEPQALSLA
jgi:hypothetical protein